MPKRLLTNPKWRDRLAWALILGVVFFSVLRTQGINSDLVRTQEQQQIDRCASGQELRDATRSNIRAVYALATGAVTPISPKDGRTPEQRAAAQRYLNIAKNFRDDSLAKVPAVSPGCEEYAQKIKEEGR